MNISVIVPVYNVEKYIERCITSIINQTFTEGVECIVINDCTPDKSMEIVERLVSKYDGSIQFKLIYHEKNKGIAAVRNTGLDTATGDYTIYIDSDDYCELDMLEKMYTKAFEEDADIVVSSFWMEFKEKQVYIKNEVSSNRKTRLKESLTGKYNLSMWNKLVRRNLYIDNEIRYIDGIDFAEDSIISYRLFYYAQRVVWLPLAFVHYIKYRLDSYTVFLSLNSLRNILNGERYVLEFFSLVNLDKELEDEIIYRRIDTRMYLLLHTNGVLQKKWNNLYHDIPNRKALKALFSHENLSLYWKFGYSLAFMGILPAFNLMKITREFIFEKLYKNRNV